MFFYAVTNYLVYLKKKTLILVHGSSGFIPLLFNPTPMGRSSQWPGHVKRKLFALLGEQEAERREYRTKLGQDTAPRTHPQ